MDFGHYKKQVGVWILKIRAKLLKPLILLTYSMLVRSQQSRFCIIVHCSAPYFLLNYNESWPISENESRFPRMVWFQFNIACQRKWITYLTEILNNDIPHPYKSNFRKGSFVMSQNVIIRPKMDFSNKADNCNSDHVLTWQVSRQK